MQRFAPIFLALLFPVLCPAFEITESTTQVLVGIAPNWDSSQVKLTLYERGKFLGKANWKPVGSSWGGRLGYNGLVWGYGVHQRPTDVRTKKEGDGRSPAGVFEFGKAWGYKASEKTPRAQQYNQITTRDLWFEDVNSPLYNQHDRLPHEPQTAAEKKAQMKQNDYAHSLKLFIRHNAEKGSIVPGAGSSIFFHIWRRDGAAATAGCTTMTESKLRDLISKIDPAKNPVYVLLPKSEYDRFKTEWKLP